MIFILKLSLFNINNLYKQFIIMNFDEKYIERCFELAKRGKGKVSPNPLVGAVLVKDNKVIGEGYHEYFGGPHAEVNAIKNAIGGVKGATLYCNLEPCCHTNKKTPPCTPLIITHGIKKVVISNIDPNPLVSGKGIEQLKDAGIKVVSGILQRKGEEINKFFFKFIRSKLPYVTLKIAASKDGKITRKIGTQTQITNEKAQKFVHQLRAEYDAVLIGANTVKIDNPYLTVRLVEGRNPERIILDGRLKSPVDAAVFSLPDNNKTWLFTKLNSDINSVSRFTDKNINVVQLKQCNKYYLELNSILKYLSDQGISSLLVEGGQNIFSEFIEKELFDEIVLINSNDVFHEGLDAMKQKFPQNVVLLERFSLDDNTVSIYRKRTYF